MRLVLCAHGTRSEAGRTAVAALVAAVAARAQLPVVEAYVDVHGPTLGSVIRHGDVVVPLLLSPGHHTEVDIAEVARRFRRVRVAPTLGPSTRLVALLHQRLLRAGLRPGDAVVLAAAGSSRPEAVPAAHRTAADLACVLGQVVVPAYVESRPGCEVPPVAAVVAAERRAGRRFVVAPYLLAPGAFLERVRRCATESGAGAVARPLLHAGPVDPLLVELVLARAAQAGTVGSRQVSRDVAC